MKYKIALLLIISLFFNLGLTAQGNQVNDVEQVIKAFQETSAEFDTYWLTVGLPFGQYTDDNYLLLEGNKLSRSFGIPEVSQLEKIGKQNFYMSKGSWGNQTTVQLELKRQNEQSSAMYFIFRITGNQSLETLEENYTLLYNKLQENQISPKINSCIQGNIGDKLSNAEQSALIDSLLHKLDAKKIEFLDTDLVKSVSAFSSKFIYSIWTGTRKMNLQIATHYDSIQKKTILTLGTPIITIEY